MAKKSCCPEPTGDIPPWFMTYSDVITLLMTFFILLLTFATNEPEFFAKVKVVSFGGGGSTGVAGDSTKLLDNDAIVLRERPNSAAISIRGSETPPVHENPALQSVSRGLKSLENTDALADASRVRIETLLAIVQDDKGEITTQGVTQLRMLAKQLKSQPLVCQILVSDPDLAEFAVTMAAILTDEDGLGIVPGRVPGRVAVGVVDPSIVASGRIVYRLSRSEAR
ncbi:flagellar motor protein MotB [Fuerstiella marisgermanici]|uniref:Flagellar motor protein MotB n=1 Tax=Fuerstiella marisgermanici TaxID=1891926 RepID=A0A1P8WJ83_9PLAN|nr:flagellar motor protein MotB [Fuerstiella marisgermanici]APZ94129.1 flagellar motor protein MotB [Fuerstiella marisgermanici]